MSLCLLLIVSLVWAGPQASNLQSLLVPLIAARTEGRVGSVAGAALVEPQTSKGSPAPLSGVALVLVPHSPALLRDLEQVKARARESEAGYFAAATDLTNLKERYEQALREAGAGDLVFSATTDARGEYLFSPVPAGEWLLIGRHETARRVSARGASQRERQRFVLNPKSLGYREVTYWLVQVTVAEGRGIEVSLTDRNPWLRGVVEDRGAPQRR